MSLAEAGRFVRAVGVLRGTAAALTGLVGDVPRLDGADAGALARARHGLSFASQLVSDAMSENERAELRRLHLDPVSLANCCSTILVRIGTTALLGYVAGVVPTVGSGLPDMGGYDADSLGTYDASEKLGEPGNTSESEPSPLFAGYL